MKLSHLRHVDGLRAIAVLSVILFHLGLNSFSGGYVGVDIFFVISGFLITRLIKEELKTENKFSFINFYTRRLRRLFPAFLVVLILSIIAGAFLFSIKLYKSLSLSAVFALLSLSNIYFWKKVNYFNADSGADPLLHTWSLSVEEQFYLFWPLLLVLAHKYRSVLALRYLPSLFFFASLSASIIFIEHKLITFYLLPFRVFEFCIGAIMVSLVNYRPLNPMTKELIALASIACVAVSVVMYTNDTSFPSYNALLPCLGAAGLIYAGDAKRFGVLLTNKFMVGTGLISYSLYLIHWPLIVFYKYYCNITVLDASSQFIIILVSFFVATLMYFMIEQPCRKPKGRTSKRFYISTIIAAGTVIFISTFIYSQNGWSWRSNSEQLNAAIYGGENYGWEQKVGDENLLPSAIIYGDSHARQYIEAFDNLGSEHRQAYKFLTHPACMSLPNITNIYQGEVRQSCIDMYEKLKTELMASETALIISYRYTKIIQNLKTGEIVNFKQNNDDVSVLINALESLLNDVGVKQKVIIFGGVPATNSKRGYVDCITAPLKSRDCIAKFPPELAEFNDLRKHLKILAKSHDQLMFIDPYEALCSEGYCYVRENNDVYYSDHAHLSKIGARKVIQYFQEDIVRFVNSND